MSMSPSLPRAKASSSSTVFGNEKGKEKDLVNPDNTNLIKADGWNSQEDSSYFPQVVNIVVDTPKSLPSESFNAKLKPLLKASAKTFFRNLLNVPELSGAPKSENKTYVLGDTDGSIARVLLIAIRSKHIKMDDAVLKDFADLLNEEAAVIETKLQYLPQFQANKVLAQKIENIMGHLEYTQSTSKLVSIGDNIHDRFSCHKEAMLELIEKLHGVGVIFIKGNHDTHAIVEYTEKLKSSSIGDTTQWGCNAVNKGFLEKSKWDDFERKFFVNCYFDEANNIFYIHNGLHVGIQDDKTMRIAYSGSIGKPNDFDAFKSHKNLGYFTAFSKNPISANQVSSLSELATIINAQEEEIYPFETEYFLPLRLTEFRPTHADLGDLFKGVTVIHGHSGEFNSFRDKFGIVGINSRNRIVAEVGMVAAAIVF